MVRVQTIVTIGIEAIGVCVETEICRGLRRFVVVGLPDGVVREAKERVRCAIQSSDYEFPFGEVVVSLAPASVPKNGSGFDLAIALSILAADGHFDATMLHDTVILGELSLDGSVREVPGVVGAAAFARRCRKRTLIIPAGNESEAGMIDGIEIIPVTSLSEAIEYFRSDQRPAARPPILAKGVSGAEPAITFADVIGQSGAKRALEVASAGGHNVLLVGPPGSGKSMLAKRFSSLLPQLSTDQAVEVLKIYSGVGDTGSCAISERLDNGLKVRRPFRSPHHSISAAGLIGGGPLAQPGEVVLAHNGVLFLDELPEFRHDVLESLRSPLEDKRVLISRARVKLTFPADFVLIAAMNPCPCGHRGTALCVCTEQRARGYTSRLSAPILERIDLQIWVPPVTIGELAGEIPSTDPTPAMRERVSAARAKQQTRLGNRLNGSLTSKELKSWCRLDATSNRLLETAAKKRCFSARSYSRVLKVARTIADLEDSSAVEAPHLAEALAYRMEL